MGMGACVCVCLSARIIVLRLFALIPINLKQNLR